MKLISFRKWLPGLAIVAMTALNAGAGTLEPLSLPELSHHADAVVRGKVKRLTCRRTDTGSLRTDIELQVSEVWKGEVDPDSFRLVQAGGVLGAHRTVVPGQPELRPGEEVLVFVVFNERREGVILSLWQGFFRVRQDRANGEWRASNRMPASRPGQSETPLPESAVPLRILRERVLRESQS